MANWFCVTDFVNVTPEDPGCYAIYKYNTATFSSKLLYIGTAQNLEKRLKKHEVRRCLFSLLKFPEVSYVKVRILFDKSKRLLLEKKLIERLRPPINYA